MRGFTPPSAGAAGFGAKSQAQQKNQSKTQVVAQQIRRISLFFNPRFHKRLRQTNPTKSHFFRIKCASSSNSGGSKKVNSIW